ncbi:hypothetical protein G9A89_015381 [Geosiphon pyriformis]|nr:hypothetical protein G9A89_015381 [Geosiphon pyriformis]
MLLRGRLGSDHRQSIDHALVARKEVIKWNAQWQKFGSTHHLSFKSRKALYHTITISGQNFAKLPWNLTFTLHQYMHMHISTSFEKKRRNNKWPNPHKITCDGKLTYYRKTKEWKFAWLRETQADGSVHAVSTDPGIRIIYMILQKRLHTSKDLTRVDRKTVAFSARISRQETFKKILCWGHYRFCQLSDRQGRRIGSPSYHPKSYTSKTCSWCANIQRIGESEGYICLNCWLFIDRDNNGAQESSSGYCLVHAGNNRHYMGMLSIAYY